MFIPTSLLGPRVTAIGMPTTTVSICTCIYIYIHTCSLDSGEQTTATCKLCTPTVVNMYALGKRLSLNRGG